jgi:hypothetical protein
MGHLSLPQYKNKDVPVVKQYTMGTNESIEVNLRIILCFFMDDGGWSASYFSYLTCEK